MHVSRAARHSLSALPALLIAVIGLVAGCAENKGQINYNLLFTDVEPIQYARILCRGIPMHDQHTCMTSVLAHYRATRFDQPDPSQVTNGPFVVVFDDDLYRGSYISQPFIAAFTVTNGSNICRGRYDAFAGDTRADFRVWCDDGSTGFANIILDVDGRNGIGEFVLNDGRRGEIVFGYRAVGGDFL
ncbi:MAG: hypothetical protein LJE69_11135 [Thiohalocapsa sp.]|uniref:hypothetical protein n=1 Tax=Thiohalocapsa sp. TaxID=2497641 RepID=UPI0025CD074A|nr:hypothetical protein [Thiohalocapsa sp.]MCG6941788.1 hypothetical protein [Thiohalocapsa sp.]